MIDAALGDIPGAELAGITFVGRGGARTPAWGDPLVRTIDAVQYRSGEGPCLQAATSLPVVRSGDLATDVRWRRRGSTQSNEGSTLVE